MAFFEWKGSYETGLKVIDTQHKKLVEIVNQLYDAMSQGKTRDVLGSIIDELHNYTVTHFSTEEELMIRFNYPLLLTHKQKHVEFTSKVKEFKTKFNQGSTMMSVEMSKYLKDWLINHIQGVDREYIALFKEKGVR